MSVIGLVTFLSSFCISPPPPPFCPFLWFRKRCRLILVDDVCCTIFYGPRRTRGSRRGTAGRGKKKCILNALASSLCLFSLWKKPKPAATATSSNATRSKKYLHHDSSLLPGKQTVISREDSIEGGGQRKHIFSPPSSLCHAQTTFCRRRAPLNSTLPSSLSLPPPFLTLWEIVGCGGNGRGGPPRLWRWGLEGGESLDSPLGKAGDRFHLRLQSWGITGALEYPHTHTKEQRLTLFTRAVTGLSRDVIMSLSSKPLLKKNYPRGHSLSRTYSVLRTHHHSTKKGINPKRNSLASGSRAMSPFESGTTSRPRSCTPSPCSRRPARTRQSRPRRRTRARSRMPPPRSTGRDLSSLQTELPRSGQGLFSHTTSGQVI